MDSCNLSDQKCTPCKEGGQPLGEIQITEYLGQIEDGWEVLDGKKIQKGFKFKNFKLALDFVNKVGEIAETQGHHPDIFLTWGKAVITLFTHKIGGLHQNDFILASKIDKIL